VVISEALIAPVMYINILLFFIVLAFIFIISFDEINKRNKLIVH
jgi:uncharacterized membrane protein